MPDLFLLHTYRVSLHACSTCPYFTRKLPCLLFSQVDVNGSSAAPLFSWLKKEKGVSVAPPVHVHTEIMKSAAPWGKLVVIFVSVTSYAPRELQRETLTESLDPLLF